MWFGIFFLSIIRVMISIPQMGKQTGPPTFFIALFVPHFITMLVIRGLQAFYIYTLLKEDRLDTTQKALWAMIVFMGSVVAFPFFWYVFFWKEDPFLILGKKPPGESK
jgi:hypothetical protein